VLGPITGGAAAVAHAAAAIATPPAHHLRVKPMVFGVNRGAHAVKRRPGLLSEAGGKESGLEQLPRSRSAGEWPRTSEATHFGRSGDELLFKRQ
jgi:hypothetical protein